ncbi:MULTISPECIES: chemotaxis protein CheW [unclassified Methanoculleus]|uniref:chemotaxis protein CheW n=1 Tax=unclassified Methanoculleus TaxID=2619537 RepID=UPI0025E6F5E4|nr:MULTISPECIES: chemotaxis protein CheW [unclassified Methanoculleus]MCK9317325.1 chemotaxis protein CheW [Methanoculleus sp.]MDD2253027.1 chemotaxis protein CheW [Methanoculleus sp.]MDD2786623.1 chemotaxis protein CheW [Methanoculleus sp.]MDD3216242.1 chemotaxis protein CheW [Methanoculleus sp.]MDD4313873.1 chemotaxis protein CheW [Methanoculleus sp.]
MAAPVDVVEFQLGEEHYALDIQIAREIVEMMPITPLPRAPEYLAGIINLRGEITNIIDLRDLLGLPESGEAENRKIVVLMPDVAGGSNVGIIVDDVYSVISVRDEQIERINDGITSSISDYVKAIIKMGAEDDEKPKTLIIWLDVQKVISDLGHYQTTA